MMTREEVLKELAGLVPVIVHWDDAIAQIEKSVEPGDTPRGSAQVTIGFLNSRAGQLVDLFCNVSTDPEQPSERDTQFTVSGNVRAITHLVPGTTDVFETTVRKARTIDYGKKLWRVKR
jgi:hypothetical protein